MIYRRDNTGWSKSILYTLTVLYDNNNICMNKIGLDIFSAYPEISFSNIESQKITEISFYNRNNRNINNNRNILPKMFKMDSFFIGLKAGLSFCHLRHISLQNVVKNIHKFEKNCKICKNHAFVANTSPFTNGL